MAPPNTARWKLMHNLRTTAFFYPVGSFGFVANSVVIPVLFTKKMNNTFSRFLVCLAIFDNVYVTCSILECVRKYFWGTELHKVRMCGRPTARTV